MFKLSLGKGHRIFWHTVEIHEIGMQCVQGITLIPRLSWEGKESLVTTALAWANPYQQNMISCFSLEKYIVIGW